jgi:hypothetical protein
MARLREGMRHYAPRRRMLSARAGWLTQARGPRLMAHDPCCACWSTRKCCDRAHAA